MRLPTQTRLRKRLRKLSEPHSGWLDVFPAILGKANGTVLTGIAGVVWVHNLLNGQDLAVYNNAVPNTPLLQVEVGQRVDMRGLWQIKGTMEPFSVPSTSGGTVVGEHHSSHEFPNADTVWVDRKQIKPLTVLVSDAANFLVKLYGAMILTANGVAEIETQTVDLSSYVPAAGAVFVAIESDDDGAISVNEGIGFAAPNVGTVNDVPAPAAGKYTRAYVLLYEGQTALSNSDIVVPMPPDQNPTSGRAIWGAITGTLSDQTDLQAALDLKLADAPSDGETYGRKDGAWEVVTTGGGGAQLVMMPDVSSPPVPVETPDGTDWVYYEV